MNAITDHFATNADQSSTKTILAAIDKIQGIIEFDLKGMVKGANDTYMHMMGYSLEDVVGKHHRMFCPSHIANTPAYDFFWQRLASGQTESGEFLRITKGGRNIWLHASYNPVYNDAGQLTGVVKFATDITATKLRNADVEARMRAIDRVQCVIEFDLSGHVLHANENFLELMGYGYEEVVGRHHRMFCKKDEVLLPAYQAFWDALKRGEYHSGEFCRFARNGRPVWIQASYNPVFGPDGQVIKVIKYATDTTAAKTRAAETSAKLNAIDRVQGVAEFSLDGQLLDANEVFLKQMGYAREEVLGQHHRVFCSADYAKTDEYAAFWAHLRQGLYHAGEFQRLTRNGREVWIQASYNPVFGPDGLPVRVVKFATDITAEKRRQAEVAAKLSAIDHFHCVLELNLDRQVLVANHNFATMVGYAIEELQGQALDNIRPEDQVDIELKSHVWSALAKGESREGKLDFVRRDGSLVSAHANFTPVKAPSGNVSKVLMMAVNLGDPLLTLA